MTPDLLEAGAGRLQAHQSRVQQEGQTESGGRSAGIGRVLRGQGPDFTHGVALYLDDISVSFDGFKALNALSLSIAVGELRCIIGPNGAGKTTMMDVITGKTRPDEGDVLFDGRIDLTTMDEAAIAELGIGRKFQKPTVFESHTVDDNILLAMKGPRSAFSSLFGWRNRVTPAERDSVLETIGLIEHRHRLAADLSHGQKQWLEIGMLLMQDPALLLLDEPVAGMTDEETERTAELFLSLQGEHSLVVVEHDMHFVEQLTQGHRTVTVLHEGSVLAEGTLATVQANPQVVEVYLGR